MPTVAWPQVHIFVSDGAETWEYSMLLTDLTYSGIAPGGDGECVWKYATTFPPTCPALGAEVWVESDDGNGNANGVVIWGPGLLVLVENDEDPDSALYTFTGQGLLTTANYKRYLGTQIFTAGTSIEDIFTKARDDLCPGIPSDDSHITPTGRTITADSKDYQGNTAKQVWDDHAKLGNSTDQPLLYYVWGNSSRGVFLELVPRPTLATLFIDLGEAVDLPITWPLDAVATRVTVKHANGIVTVDGGGEVDLQWRSNQVWTIDDYRDMSSKLSTDEDASNYAKTLLNAEGHVHPVARQLTVSSAHVVTDSGGNPVPVHEVHRFVGKVIAINGLVSGNNRLPITPLLISEARWNDEPGQMVLALEEIQSTDIELLANLVAKNGLPGTNGDGGGGGGGGGSDLVDTIVWVVDNGGSTIPSGRSGIFQIGFSCTLQGVTLIADQIGSVNVKPLTGGLFNYPTVDLGDMTNNHPVSITDSVKGRQLDFSSWSNTGLNAGDLMAFDISGADIITRLMISLKVQRHDAFHEVINFQFYNNGAVLTEQEAYGYAEIGFPCKITYAMLTTNVADTMTAQVNLATFDNAPPHDDDKILQAHLVDQEINPLLLGTPVTIPPSDADWDLSSGAILGFEIPMGGAPSRATRATLSLLLLRT